MFPSQKHTGSACSPDLRFVEHTSIYSVKSTCGPSVTDCALSKKRMTQSFFSPVGRTAKLPADVLRRLSAEHLTERDMVSHLYALGFRVSKTTLHRHLQSLRQQSVCSANSQVQTKKKLTPRTSRWLSRQIRVHNVRTTSQLHSTLVQHGLTVSKRTVLRNLQASETLRFKFPRKRFLMTYCHMRGRVLWAQRFLNRNFNWSGALFADETVFTTDGPAFRTKMWQDTRDPPPVLVRSGAGSQAIHIWGAFSADFVPDLVVLPHPLDSKAYCDALATALLTSDSFQTHTLFHDRHTAHHSKLTNRWLNDHAVTAELFPPKCADLNPIENLWAQLKRKVYPQNKTYTNTHQLLRAIRAAWREIQADKAGREEYVNSMAGRLHEVINSKGRWTKH